jgi:hypothetical protein
MVGSANIVSWNDRGERSSSIRAGWLQTTESIGRNRALGTITITPGCNTSVDSGGVASPKFNISISDRLASACVNDVDIQVCDGALLASKHIRPDQLSNNP